MADPRYSLPPPKVDLPTWGVNESGETIPTRSLAIVTDIRDGDMTAELAQADYPGRTRVVVTPSGVANAGEGRVHADGLRWITVTVPATAGWNSLSVGARVALTPGAWTGQVCHVGPLLVEHIDGTVDGAGDYTVRARLDRGRGAYQFVRNDNLVAGFNTKDYPVSGAWACIAFSDFWSVTDATYPDAPGRVVISCYPRPCGALTTIKLTGPIIIYGQLGGVWKTFVASTIQCDQSLTVRSQGQGGAVQIVRNQTSDPNPGGVCYPWECGVEFTAAILEFACATLTDEGDNVLLVGWMDECVADTTVTTTTITTSTSTVTTSTSTTSTSTTTTSTSTTSTSTTVTTTQITTTQITTTSTSTTSTSTTTLTTTTQNTTTSTVTTSTLTSTTTLTTTSTTTTSTSTLTTTTTQVTTTLTTTTAVTTTTTSTTTTSTSTTTTSTSTLTTTTTAVTTTSTSTTSTSTTTTVTTLTTTTVAIVCCQATVATGSCDDVTEFCPVNISFHCWSEVGGDPGCTDPDGYCYYTLESEGCYGGTCHYDLSGSSCGSSTTTTTVTTTSTTSTSTTLTTTTLEPAWYCMTLSAWHTSGSCAGAADEVLETTCYQVGSWEVSKDGVCLTNTPGAGQSRRFDIVGGPYANYNDCAVGCGP